MIDWNNLFKLRIANSDESFHFHEVVKLIVLMKLLKKYKRDLNIIRVYTEFPTVNKRRCDVYLENIRTKESHAYEIQKQVSDEWLKSITEDYKEWDVPFMKTSDLIIIPLKKLSKNIDELNNQLDEYII